MPAHKKYTQFIFDEMENVNGAETFGYLGMMFEVIKDLTKLRTQIPLSQNDIAEKSGIAQPTITKIEAGRGNPTLMQLIKITKALGYKIKFEPAKFGPGDYEGYME